ncbi:MAG: KOW domain-containing RNA-binding protein [Tissierellia bacterium]|nr:KOW domain-containing RNA-binding protein [Tissierellia bacterium]
MILTTDVKIGQVTKSKSGRDKGRLFIILKIVDENYVLISDGGLRGIERPKKKKIKHLMIYRDVIENFMDDSLPVSMNNAKIRECLRPFQTESNM